MYEVEIKNLITNETILKFTTLGGLREMTTKEKILAFENRIALLESRAKKDNGRIVAKLKRKLYALKNEDH
jgi:hypothetical protein